MLLIAASTATQDGFFWIFLTCILGGMLTKPWEHADNFCQ